MALATGLSRRLTGINPDSTPQRPRPPGLQLTCNHEQLQAEANPRAGQSVLRNAGEVRARQIRLRREHPPRPRITPGKVRAPIRLVRRRRISNYPHRQEPPARGRGHSGRLQPPTRLLGSKRRERRSQSGDEQKVHHRFVRYLGSGWNSRAERSSMLRF